jgi:hypothetical protein
MDARLREFLKRHGINDETLDALERGDVPAGPDVLRKAMGAKSVLQTIGEIHATLDEIQTSLDGPIERRRARTCRRAIERTRTMIETIRPIDDNTFRLGTLDLPVTLLPQGLRRRYDLICSAIQKGDPDLGGALRALSRDIQLQCGPDLLIRAAQRTPQTNGAPGLAEKDKARITDLSARAREYADKEKRKEGVKAGAGEVK